MTIMTAQDKEQPSPTPGSNSGGAGHKNADSRFPPSSTLKGWKRLAYLAVSGIFFALGALGVLLPGLPATPFLLLTSFCLVRSSPRLNDRLLRSRIFGPILVDWQVRGGIRRRDKIKAVVVVFLTLALTTYLADTTVILKLLIICLASVGIVVILRLPQPKA